MTSLQLKKMSQKLLSLGFVELSLDERVLVPHPFGVWEKPRIRVLRPRTCNSKGGTPNHWSLLDEIGLHMGNEFSTKLNSQLQLEHKFHEQFDRAEPEVTVAGWRADFLS